MQLDGAILQREKEILGLRKECEYWRTSWTVKVSYAIIVIPVFVVTPVLFCEWLGKTPGKIAYAFSVAIMFFVTALFNAWLKKQAVAMRELIAEQEKAVKKLTGACGCRMDLRNKEYYIYQEGGILTVERTWDELLCFVGASINAGEIALASKRWRIKYAIVATCLILWYGFVIAQFWMSASVVVILLITLFITATFLALCAVNHLREYKSRYTAVRDRALMSLIDDLEERIVIPDNIPGIGGELRILDWEIWALGFFGEWSCVLSSFDDDSRFGKVCGRMLLSNQFRMVVKTGYAIAF